MAIKFVTTGPWGTGEGAPLDAPDIDNNFYELQLAINNLIANPPSAVSIDHITLVGDQLTFYMTDATTQGPFTIPVFHSTPQGEWQPDTVYFKHDTVSNSGKLYWIGHNHTSGTVFDPEAEDVDGFLYILVLEPVAPPFDLNIFTGGTMYDAQKVLYMDTRHRWQLPIDLTGSKFNAIVAATDETTIIFKKNGAAIGSIMWAATETVPTIAFTAIVTFEIDDIFEIDGPAVADVTLADIAYNIVGVRL